LFAHEPLKKGVGLALKPLGPPKSESTLKSGLKWLHPPPVHAELGGIRRGVPERALLHKRDVPERALLHKRDVPERALLHTRDV